ncbi:MAG: quinone-dependent dihydroorotate dehydrogenase [Deltaproteobacteria bacterium]
MIYKFFRFFLFLFDPETIHHITLFFLSLRPIQWFLSLICQFEDERLEKKIRGLHFKNPIGLAAGFDKNGVAILGFQSLGFGFLEIGTVTPQAQSGNPKPRIRRFIREQALVNWLGFNNDGVEAVVGRVQKIRNKIKIPIGLNIGKGKETPLDKAIDDYLFCLEKGYSVFDFFVVNISSPNTLGLRNLQMGQYLEPLLRNLRKKSHDLSQERGMIERPLFVKISPDLTGEELKETVSLCEKYQISAMVATNTTTDYQLLQGADIEKGGVSGRPLKEKATSLLESIHAMKTGMVLVGVGGILTPKDVKERFEKGATLIELYTGLIFSGPFFVRRIKKFLLHPSSRGAKRRGISTGYH